MKDSAILPTRRQLLAQLKALAKVSEEDAQQGVEALKEAFDELVHKEREEALKRFVAAGGETHEFVFKQDDTSAQFYRTYQEDKQRRISHRKEAAQHEAKNLKEKQVLLKQLRHLVEKPIISSDRSKFEDLCAAWQQIGPVPARHHKGLHANYQALIRRFWDKRRIYTQLSQMDKERNLQKKQALCQEIEALEPDPHAKTSYREAQARLNAWRRTYREIGPAPREAQEEIAKQFHQALKPHEAHCEKLKRGEEDRLQQHLEQKKALLKQVETLLHKTAPEKPLAWQQRTEEVLALKKKWEQTGPLPHVEEAKGLTSAFWRAFKAYVQKKNQFFDELDKARAGNTEKKEEILKQLQVLQDGECDDAWQKKLSELQEAWKKTGAPPKAHRHRLDKAFEKQLTLLSEKQQQHTQQLLSQHQPAVEEQENLLKQLASAKDTSALSAAWKTFTENLTALPALVQEQLKQKATRALEKLWHAVDKKNQNENMQHEIAQCLKKLNPRQTLPFVKERKAQAQKDLRRLEEELFLLKRNLSFFAHTPPEHPLRKEVEDKIRTQESRIQQIKDSLART